VARAVRTASRGLQGIPARLRLPNRRGAVDVRQGAGAALFEDRQPIGAAQGAVRLVGVAKDGAPYTGGIASRGPHLTTFGADIGNCPLTAL